MGTMPQHPEQPELIERVATWAAGKKLPLGPGLLEEILELRQTRDGLAVGDWPAGSVEHLLLVRWPGHGSVEPDPELMGQTLDTYWRFLRGNGLMSFGSAPPKRLVLEWRRAVPRLDQRYADPKAQGINRQLFTFADELGIDLRSADSTQELQARLDQVVQEWNALPQEERLRRSPRGSGPATSGADQAPFGAQDHLADRPQAPDGDGPDERGDPDDPDQRGDPDERGGVGVLDDPDDLDDLDEDAQITMSDPADSARDVRRSGFVQRCLALADWVGEGKEITARDVLRPAAARAAYRDLDLGLHAPSVRMHGQAYQDELRAHPARLEEVADSLLVNARSALDLIELDQPWAACLGAGLIELRGRRAVAVTERPATDRERVTLGVLLAVSLLDLLPERRLQMALHALFPQAAPGDTGWDRAELRESWWRAGFNGWGKKSPHPSREWSDLGIDNVVEQLTDLGVWRVGGERLGPTAFGHDLALMAISLLESGLLESGLLGGEDDG